MSVLAHAVGKYGPFIWSAYAVTAVIFAWMIADTLARAARFRRQTQRLEEGRAK
jgi:heme exporter protein D